MTDTRKILFWGPALSGRTETVNRLKGDPISFSMPGRLRTQHPLGGERSELEFFWLAPMTSTRYWDSFSAMRRDSNLSPVLSELEVNPISIVLCFDSQAGRIEANEEALKYFVDWWESSALNARIALQWNKIDTPTATRFEDFAQASECLRQRGHHLLSFPVFRTAASRGDGIEVLRAWVLKELGIGSLNDLVRITMAGLSTRLLSRDS